MADRDKQYTQPDPPRKPGTTTRDEPTTTPTPTPTDPTTVPGGPGIGGGGGVTPLDSGSDSGGGD